MNVRFGTDGIRGPAGQAPIDEATACGVGAAAARLAREAGSDAVLIARDTRPSGPELTLACARGVSGAGLIPLDAGVVPTAALAVGLHEGIAGAGVMITASHNPWVDNGFKLFDASGRKLDEADSSRVESWLAHPSPAGQGSAVDAHERVRGAWERALASRVPLERLRGRRIALDLAEGAGLAGLAWLQRAVPVDWVVMRGDRINDGVGSEHPERLALIVVESGCDAGIAVDGDADRCVLVDDLGRVVDGDALTWLLARALGVQALAVTEMSNGALAPALPGVKLTFTPVGDKYLAAAMREQHIPLGAEESGHVLFADHAGGDGLLAGLRALASVDGKLSDALAGFVPWPRVKAKVKVSSRPPLDQVVELQRAVREGEQELGEGGRVFLRYSGTEPVLRLLVEGRDAAVVRAVAARVEALARAVL
jgi:phosphoglucosamine mutase